MSHPSLRLSLLLLICAAVAVPANAQDDPRFALVASFPNPTVSFQWELTDRFALRFDGSYSYRDESTEETTGNDPAPPSPFGSSTSIVINTDVQSTTHTVAFGLTGIVTLRRTDDVRLYVAPRVSIGRTQQEARITTSIPQLPPGLTLNFPRAGTETFDQSSTSTGGGASFGAAVNVHRRLALFGEAGFTYAEGEGPLVSVIGPLGSTSDTDIERTTFGTRAVAGVMFRF